MRRDELGRPSREHFREEKETMAGNAWLFLYSFPQKSHQAMMRHTRTQRPLMLTFAMTAHAAQGLPLKGAVKIMR